MKQKTPKFPILASVVLTNIFHIQQQPHYMHQRLELLYLRCGIVADGGFLPWPCFKAGAATPGGETFTVSF